MLRKFFFFILIVSLVSCSSKPTTDNNLVGTWRSLWEKDMTLHLQFDTGNRFKVILNRTGQTHTNSGWFTTKDNVFLLKDSVNYPLPVCNLADTGKYHFERMGDTLLFKVLEDPCDRRAGALQLERFVKVN